jgi:hypothetical protein
VIVPATLALPATNQMIVFSVVGAATTGKAAWLPFTLSYRGVEVSPMKPLSRVGPLGRHPPFGSRKHIARIGLDSEKLVAVRRNKNI